MPLALQAGVLAVAMPQSGTSDAVLFSRDRSHATTTANSTATTATTATTAAAFSAASPFALRATAALAPGLDAASMSLAFLSSPLGDPAAPALVIAAGFPGGPPPT